ncbi:hypothetical protein VNO77_02020 [Canavalia gladiata]|uniref:Uncharacterized protein n=1 Tax=Canavalia gladiata TaxID=3824 RepID=A0AAN9RAW0_CANGL
MELARVLSTNGGVAETSYAKNSFIQQKVIHLTRPIREEAITSLYCNKLPTSLAIADMGCSSGPNTLNVVSEIIKTVENLCRELHQTSPEYKIFLNDLPGNDFNSIFRSLDSFKEKLLDEMETSIGPCYFSGVPGSFYSRLFPNRSLHFVHSSYSLHWLSKVPEGVNNNKGNIYIGSTSPSNVVKAYYDQFQRDFNLFLKCRAEEVIDGGCMVLTILGRKIKIHPAKRLPVSESLNDNGYNITQCMRSVAEPLLVSHFGEVIIEEVFSRYQQILADRMSKEKTKFINVTVLLTRKA